jgi:hypothetical protein
MLNGACRLSDRVPLDADLTVRRYSGPSTRVACQYRTLAFVSRRNWTWASNRISRQAVRLIFPRCVASIRRMDEQKSFPAWHPDAPLRREVCRCRL